MRCTCGSSFVNSKFHHLYCDLVIGSWDCIGDFYLSRINRILKHTDKVKILVLTDPTIQNQEYSIQSMSMAVRRDTSLVCVTELPDDHKGNIHLEFENGGRVTIASQFLVDSSFTYTNYDFVFCDRDYLPSVMNYVRYTKFYILASYNGEIDRRLT